MKQTLRVRRFGTYEEFYKGELKLVWLSHGVTVEWVELVGEQLVVTVLEDVKAFDDGKGRIRIELKDGQQ